MILCLLAGFFAACEQEVDIYHAQGNDRLNFVFEERGDTLTEFTFIYTPKEVLRDTLWFEMETSGYVTDYPRPICLAQIPAGKDDAEPGKHYIAFDDPAMAAIYVVPANRNKVRLPIIIKRDDPRLKEQKFVLRFGIAENEHFKPGFPSYQEKTFTISDIITRPQNWTGLVSWYCFGKYGNRKYEFMLETGRKMGITINEDFFKELVPSNPPDMAYCDYWGMVFRDALEEENAARIAAGQDVLREDPKEGEEAGEEIYFAAYTTSE